MTNEQLRECIEAQDKGEPVECKLRHGKSWEPKMHGYWNTDAFDYRVAREPREAWVIFYQNDTTCDPYGAAYSTKKRAEDGLASDLGREIIHMREVIE